MTSEQNSLSPASTPLELTGPSRKPPSALDALKSWPAAVGLGTLVLIIVLCVGSLPWTLARLSDPGATSASLSTARYEYQNREALRLPPAWAPMDARFAQGYQRAGVDAIIRQEASRTNVSIDEVRESAFATSSAISPELARNAQPFYVLGTDHLGRSVLARSLLGGSISLTIGLAAAALSVFLGTMYGAIAGYVGGRVDSLMMRIVDVMYGLPYILLVVLLAVAVDGLLDRWQSGRVAEIQALSAQFIDAGLQTPGATREVLAAQARERFGTGELSSTAEQIINLITLLIAIGGVSWLTMARVIRGQVLSLKAQPFMEAARALGLPAYRQFLRHLLPNLIGPVVVYATLTVPQAILQESFLSFLGIGVRPPLPSWGNLAADGLGELNNIRSHWWLLAFPCLLLAATLLALNFLGEALREALDPKRTKR
jgi:oligopeptide transport system permease protein